MHRGQIITFVTVAGMTVAACGGNYARKEIEGNNTGGVIPPAAAAGQSVQVLADGHCAKYGTRARITFSGAEAGGDTVFICETPAGPAVFSPAPGAAAAAAAPASQQTPINR